jgi:O-antigen ligase
MSLKKKLFLMVSSIYIIYILFPLFADSTKIPIQVVSLFAFISCFLLYPSAFLNSTIKWFGIYVFILFIYLVLERSLGGLGIGTVTDNKKIIIEIAFLLPTLSIFSIIHYLRDFKLLRNITIVSLIILLFSFLYLMPMIIQNSNILRTAVFEYLVTNYKVAGTPNYTLMHAYIIGVPALFLNCKYLQNKWKYLMIGISLLFIYIIINSYITTNLISLMLIVLFSIVYRKNNISKSLFVLVFICILSFLMYEYGFFISMFNFLELFFDGTAVHSKIVDFRNVYLLGSLEGADTIVGRENYHQISWNSFFSNIFIGGENIGGHSNFIDRLGGLGLLGFIPFIMIIITQIKQWNKYIVNKEKRMFYYLGVGVSLILLYQKGLFGQEGWLFLIILLPGLILLLNDMEIKKLRN